MVLVAFLLRLGAWAYLGTGSIESEGAEYAKIAQNLRSGVGFVGLVSAGPQVLFPPLYSLLIVVVSYLTNDCEVAGRLISLVFGSLLPLAVFGVASRIFSRRTGYVSAWLSVFHPLSVYLSFMVYSEGPYATLLLAAMYVGLRALDTTSVRSWAPVGLVCALAYLMRPEGFALAAITGVFAVLAPAAVLGARAKRAAVFAGAFLVLALPEVIFLHQKTGKWALETKSSVLFSYTGARILAAEANPGVPYQSAGLTDTPTKDPDETGGYPETWQEKWAVFGVNSELEETGMAMRPFAEVAARARVPLGDKLKLLKKGIHLNAPMLVQRVTSNWIGPLLPLMAFLGALRRPWRGRQALGRLYVTAIMAAPVLATFFVLWNDHRYYFIFVPMFCIWAGNGALEMGSWFGATFRSVRAKFPSAPRALEAAVPAIIAAALVLLPLRPVLAEYQFTDSGVQHRVERELGNWIAGQQRRQIGIMDPLLALSFHAGVSRHWFFPYCSGDVALGFIKRLRVDYVILRRDFKFTKYYTDWVENGIPDPSAELLQPPVVGADRFLIYRFHHAAPPSPDLVGVDGQASGHL